MHTGTYTHTSLTKVTEFRNTISLCTNYIFINIVHYSHPYTLTDTFCTSSQASPNITQKIVLISVHNSTHWIFKYLQIKYNRMSETHRLRLVQNHTGLTCHWFCMYITFLQYSALNWPSDFVISCRSCIGTFCKPIIQTYGVSPLRVTHDYRSTFPYIQFLFQTTKRQENFTYCHRKCFVI